LLGVDDDEVHAHEAQYLNGVWRGQSVEGTKHTLALP
jgi:hypothetical protein